MDPKRDLCQEFICSYLFLCLLFAFCSGLRKSTLLSGVEDEVSECVMYFKKKVFKAFVLIQLR